MNIKETFLALTDRTYPHKTEEMVYHLLPNLEVDDFGNLYKIIGQSTTMFTSHLDTATSAFTTVNHVIEGDIIKTDGKSILGADDKAGVTIMLHMIENNIPGLYYFFLGEEVGCVGSKKLSTHLKVTKSGIYEFITKVISFDRRGHTSVITHQSSSRCCSEEFGEALSKELSKTGLSYKNDSTGVYTDSAQFVRIYAECTNISVGYKNEHTFSEQQDIKHLEDLCEAVLKVDWENLPISRDPSIYDYKSTRYNWDDWDDEGYGIGYNGIYGKKDYITANAIDTSWSYPKSDIEFNIHFYDKKYSYVSSVTRTKDVLVNVDFHKNRIKYEEILIEDLMLLIDVEYDSFIWDGYKLTLKHSVGHTTTCFRTELSEFLPELDFWKKEIEDDKDETIVGSYMNEKFIENI
jgi:hypothetical protein